jgi:hypothetical protein
LRNVPEKKSGVSLLTLTFAVLSSSLNRKGVVARLEKVNDFETRFASPGPLFQKVKK